MQHWCFVNISHRIDLGDLTAGAGITGLSPHLHIRRNVDGQWWTGAAWNAGVQVLNFTEKDSTNEPGFYYYDYTPTATGTYTIHKYITGGTAYDFDRTYTLVVVDAFSITDDTDLIPDSTTMQAAFEKLGGKVSSSIGDFSDVF